MTLYLLIFVAAFLIGSLPTGYLVAKAKGINIRTIGSGNIGATNVTRAMGKAWGAFVLIVDALKGFIPVFLVKEYITSPSPERMYVLMTTVGALAVAGHVFTPFLKFKGGKGIATTLGVLLAISPVLALILILIWIIAFLITRISSVGALSSALLMPVIVLFIFHKPILNIMIGFSIFMTIFIFFTHRENIKRLYRGEEKGFKKQ
ncbi:MAG: glycerol-3-phosphate 1-O-acyltransferase PlsY [bacterium]